MRLSEIIQTLNEDINITIHEVNYSFKFDGTCKHAKTFFNASECECWKVLEINGWTDADCGKGFFLRISVQYEATK